MTANFTGEKTVVGSVRFATLYALSFAAQ